VKLRTKLFSVCLLLGTTVVVSGGSDSGYRVLHNFAAGEDGAIPSAGPTLDAKGNLYGTTNAGGGSGCDGYGCGTVFELTQGANGEWRQDVLLNFTDSTGGASSYNLVFDNAGELFGGTVALIAGGPAPIFKLTHGKQGWSFHAAYKPGGLGLVFGDTGSLYGFIGLGKYQCGAIGELSPGSNGWVYTRLYSFCSQKGGADGWDPLAPLSWDSRGNLYGTTYAGGNGPPNCHGSAGCGVAFQLAHNSDGSWTYHVLHRFANFKTDGQYPYGGLTVDGKGNVFGTTTHGGQYDSGTVFELTPTSGGHWKQTVLYDFPSIYLGGAPWANLLFDKAGNLYGSAGGGDLSCPGTCGVIFKLSPQAGGKWKYSLVHKFHGTDGDGPNGLTMDAAGKLYGTTMSGGQYNYGVAFELTP
jgi:hypothetical protein